MFTSSHVSAMVATQTGSRRNEVTIALRGVALLLLTLTLAAPARAQPAFADATATSGLAHKGETYGASWGDLNNDGFPDLFASNHRTRPSLFLNRGNGTFYETGPQVLTWRNRPNADTHGASWADIDNDGDQDLLVSSGTGNLSQLLFNERQRLVDRTRERGLTTTNLGGRLPVWLDYDDDKLIDFVMTQFGGIAKLYRQGPPGFFTETTGDAKLLCLRFHYGQLIDVTNDGVVDFMCSDQDLFPQKIYNTEPLPWAKVFDSSNPAAFLRPVPRAVDSAIADFNRDGRVDLFVIGRVELHPSGVTQSSPTHFESHLTDATKGFRFVTAGQVKFDLDWNKQDVRTTTRFTRIKIGASGWNPAGLPFTLDPSNPAVSGMPPAPTTQDQIPVMRIGYSPSLQQWTVVVHSQLSETSPVVFSEVYFKIDSTSAISGLVPTGLAPSDFAQRPSLMVNRSGGFLDETVAAGLDAPIECSTVAPGDFDNDMDVDLYLGCRTGASNLPNILYENLGNGTFRKVDGAGGALGPVGVAVASGAGWADSVVTADYNVDGFLDLYLTNGLNLRPRLYGGPTKLYRNKGNANRWIELDLVGTRSERDATGARIFATANGITQVRVQDGGYHRWSQNLKRTHFGLAGATVVDLRVEWPSGGVQTFNDVSTNKLYRIIEGGGIAAVKLGVAPAYPCGAPRLNAAVDKGIFLWRDCPTGEWRMRTAAAGGSAIFAGSFDSSASFVRVSGVGLNSADKLDYQTNPARIVFRFDTRGTATDGVVFLARDGASTCVRIDAPAGSKVLYGPFRKALTPPFNIETQAACN
jgi:hypothetical protein